MIKIIIVLTVSLITLNSKLASAQDVNWNALATQCIESGMQNFRLLTSNQQAMDLIRQQMPEYMEKFLGFGPEVASSEISFGKTLYKYQIDPTIVHPDLDEVVAPIRLMFVIEVKGPNNVTNNTLYTETIFARNISSSYNCHYDVNFRLGAVHSLPFNIDTFIDLTKNLVPLH